MWWKRRVYLDVAAGERGNPSSPHEEGRQAKRMLEDARKQIARLTEVQADDVIFTSGATEANALAMHGVVRALRERAGRDTPGRNNLHILYLPTAHRSVVENARMLAAEGVAVEALPVREGRVDTEVLAQCLRKETALVSMDAVCGETGIIWNTREVAEALRRARPGAAEHIYLHVDASQAPFTEKVSRAHFDADLLVLDGAKVGARGVGALIAHRTVPLAPLYGGGSQERGLRPGSEVPELAHAFADALAAAAAGRERFRARARSARAALAAAITHTIPDALVTENTNAAKQAPNLLNLSLPGRDTDYLVALLDEAGFAVATKSACETESEEGSRAVFILTGDAERAKSTLRISWGPSVGRFALTQFARALREAVAFIDNVGQE